MHSTIIPCKKMKRSKSLNSLDMYRNEDSEWDKSIEDSGVLSTDGVVSLERKVDKLSDVCMEQARVLAALAQQVGTARQASDDQLTAVLSELLNDLAEDRGRSGEGGARSLLNAIEAHPALERRVGDAFTELLQSEDLKQRIITSTSASVKELIRGLFNVEVSSLIVPVMERAHQQLLTHVTKMVATAFTDLEENTACNAEALRQTSQSLQAALRRHQTMLQEAFDGTSRLVEAVSTTTEKVIKRELKQWRQENVLPLPPAVSECDSGRVESPSPSECGAEEGNSRDGNTGLTAVDRMMITAEVTKLIKDGEVNEAFTRALVAMDLGVVAAACRAAAPALAARPAPAPPVLLSLLQQLATDLLLDTDLKCSYMEYALLNLNPLDPVTRAHLPFVAGELSRHLAAFLHKYPHHIHSHRIAAIIDSVSSIV